MPAGTHSFVIVVLRVCLQRQLPIINLDGINCQPHSRLLVGRALRQLLGRLVACLAVAENRDAPIPLFAEEVDKPRGEGALARTPDAETPYYK